MNTTAQVKKQSNELILTCTDSEGKFKKKMVFDFEDMPLMTEFEYRDEIYNLEMFWNGFCFVLWIGQDGALQEVDVELV